MNLQKLEVIRQDIYQREHFTYLNLSIYNPITNNALIPANFATNLNFPIIQDPEAYVATIVSFNLPASGFPLFTFQNNTYRITLSYGADDYSQYLTFVPYASAELLTNHVFAVQQFLDSINNALAAQFALLIAAHVGVVNAAPYIVYNDDTYSLICDGLNYGNNVLNQVKIYFNEPLYQYFIPMQAFLFGINLPTFKDAQIIVKDNGAGSGTGSLSGTIYTISTEYDPTAAWSFVKSIIVTSGTAGIKNHILLTNVAVNGQIGNNIPIPIIGTLDVTINEMNRSSYLNYEPNFPIFNDITSKVPLVNINFNFSYLTRDLQVNPVMLYPGQSSNLIVQFKHKTILS